jgi:uncharacterized membrane protein
MHFVDIVTLVATGLLVGNELAVSLFINPVMWRLNAEAQARALSLFAKLLGRVMPFWYALCLLLLAVETWLRRGRPGFSFLLAAAVLWVAVIVFSITVLVPINNRIAAVAADAPLATWLPSHKRWDRLHRVRIVLLVVALVLLVHGLRLA